LEFQRSDRKRGVVRSKAYWRFGERAGVRTPDLLIKSGNFPNKNET
jgi:hypothetical protein